MEHMREDELEAMAERDADDYEREKQQQLNDLLSCSTVNDLKLFIIKHLIGV